eukprot:1158924-Pelagomonas_calceolata.AAC.17
MRSRPSIPITAPCPLAKKATSPSSSPLFTGAASHKGLFPFRHSDTDGPQSMTSARVRTIACEGGQRVRESEEIWAQDLSRQQRYKECKQHAWELCHTLQSPGCTEDCKKGYIGCQPNPHSHAASLHHMQQCRLQGRAAKALSSLIQGLADGKR